ncbi:hypothetical protein PQA73_gp06 [Erwinia phage Pavtok]|uniref:Uncharacterized protein n=1 Tax=Erwinia phage Pavtok TaxID=2267655 RepID=A0A345BLW3_9CAUD|nr:hypothetical protein PQA73_gp06 [Erwinia phage Pavtok]AXF51434.1 hypothetical protein PAVTOK_6 [Erwinia phage Pavtok]
MAHYDLDLTQPAFSKARGELTIYGAWHGKRLRPCLVVLPTYRPGTPLVIEVDDAWRWNPDDIEADPRANMQLTAAFLMANSMDASNPFTAMKVASLVHDHLGDLLRIPPKPGETIVVADAIQTDRDSGVVTHREIIQRV